MGNYLIGNCFTRRRVSKARMESVEGSHERTIRFVIDSRTVRTAQLEHRIGPWRFDAIRGRKLGRGPGSRGEKNRPDTKVTYLFAL